MVTVFQNAPSRGNAHRAVRGNTQRDAAGFENRVRIQLGPVWTDFKPLNHGVGGKLQLGQARIDAALLEQSRMAALLHDASFIEYKYTVSAPYSRQPVGDNEGCAPFHHALKRLLHLALAFSIKRTCGLVQQQDRGIA